MERVFAVLRSRGPAWDDSKPLEGQVDWPAHAAFMDALFDERFAALVGPLEDTRDALLILRASSAAQIAGRLDSDPWTMNGLLVTRQISPWQLRLGSVDQQCEREVQNQAPSSQPDGIAARLEAAFNAGDAAALASLYADDAVLMPPNEPMVSGRGAIEGWFERALQQTRSVRITPFESTAMGDRAFQAGTFTIHAQGGATSPAAGERTPSHTAKYVLLLKKSAGGWKIQYDIWSLDQPMSG